MQVDEALKFCNVLRRRCPPGAALARRWTAGILLAIYVTRMTKTWETSHYPYWHQECDAWTVCIWFTSQNVMLAVLIKPRKQMWVRFGGYKTYNKQHSRYQWSSEVIRYKRNVKVVIFSHVRKPCEIFEHTFAFKQWNRNSCMKNRL
jgi:hypothetical protein